jgi:hypothetical protein
MAQQSAMTSQQSLPLLERIMRLTTLAGSLTRLPVMQMPMMAVSGVQQHF